MGLEPPSPPRNISGPMPPRPGRSKGGLAPAPERQPACVRHPGARTSQDRQEGRRSGGDQAGGRRRCGGRRRLWLSYLFVLFYLAVAAGAVTHADLFLENPVKLPFLNIDLPLLAFFFLAPILFLFVHAYTLVHLVMLTDKAKHFDQALRWQIGADNGLGEEANEPPRRHAPACGGNCRATSSSSFWPGPRFAPSFRLALGRSPG